MAKKIDKIEISDALIERPIGFLYRGHQFSIYQPTLGKIQLVSRLLSSIGLDEVKEPSGLFKSILLAAEMKRDICKRILAYITLPGADCLDEKKVSKRLRTFRWIRATDLATVITTYLSMDRSDEIINFYGLDREARDLERAAKAKEKNKSSVDFAGKSIWGTMIDSACERYGWTYQYVLWGISYCALRLLFSDQVKTLFMSEAERKRAAISSDRRTIDASNAAALNSFIKNTNWN